MARSSIELDLKVLAILAQIFVMVVVDGPERGQMAGLHAGQKVLSPAALQLHQATQTTLSVSLHYLQSMWNVTLVKDPAKVEKTSTFRTFRNPLSPNLHIRKDINI